MQQGVVSTQASADELEQFLQDGGTLGMLNDISPDMLEQLYALAYEQYQAGKWQEAQKLFQMLCILDHYDARFYLGLGACRQANGEWEQAIQSYSYGALLDMKDARFPFYAAECHLHMDALDAAESGFQAAQALGREQASCTDLVARAGIMQEAVVLKRKKRKTP